MGGLGQSGYPMTGYPTPGNFQAQSLGAGLGLSQYLPTGQSLPTQSLYQNYLPSLQAGVHGGAVKSGLAHGLTGGQQTVSGAPAPLSAVGGPVQGKPMNNGFNAAQFMAESLQPVLVDFPPLATIHDMRQAGRLFPALRSSNEKA